MSGVDLPEGAKAWLRQLDRLLGTLPDEERREIIDGFRAHFIEAIESGVDIGTVLDQVGGPQQAADESLREYRIASQGAPATPTRYFTTKRAFQYVATALCLVAFVVILLLPSYVGVTIDEDGNVITETQSVAAVGDVGFIVTIALPALVSLAPLFLRGRTWNIASIVVAVLLTMYVAFGWLNTGYFLFAPAAAAAIIASLLGHTRRPAP